jgi:cytochrome c oxidase subunit 2
MKQLPASLITLVVGIVVTLISFWVGQTLDLLPEQVSEQAPLVDNLFKIMVIIGTAIFLVVQGALLFFVIWFRHRPGDEGDGSPIEGNIPLEIVWTAIPSIIVIALGVYSVQVYAEMGGFDPGGGMVGHDHMMVASKDPLMGSAIAGSLEEAHPMADMAEATETKAPIPTTYGLGAPSSRQGEAADLVVNVIGVQYAWLFSYPNSGIFAAELHIPVGKSVQLNIEAQDVIHSFWLPQFRLKQDALPGQKAELRFKATKTGTYPIVCAELCGSYHGSMRTQIVIHEPEEFEAWVAENRLAQADFSPDTIALSPENLSEAEFLAPYGQEMGMDKDMFAQLNHHGDATIPLPEL